MSKLRSVLMVIVGLLAVAMSILMFVGDAEYIFTGKTVNLNEVLTNGEELPSGKFVTYECYYPMGSYGEIQSYYSFIPLPGKTHEFAMMTESNIIISAEIGKKSKIDEFNSKTEDFLSDKEIEPIVLTGQLKTNGDDLDQLLEDYFSDIDLASNGLILTSYSIDTTQTRAGNAALYSFFLLASVLLIVIYVRKLMTK